MPLIRKDNIYFLWGVVIVIHLMMFGLCGFSCYRFFVLTYDPTAYALIAMLLGFMIVFDIVAVKSKMLVLIFTRCTFDAIGIHCRGFCVKSWDIPWNKICAYGIVGYYYSAAGVFFTIDPQEKCVDDQSLRKLNGKRVHFPVSEELWYEISKYMPEDMKENLRESINKENDCFYMRWVG